MNDKKNEVAKNALIVSESCTSLTLARLVRILLYSALLYVIV